MANKAERFIDKMPFAGKFTLQPAMRGYVRSQPGKEWLKFAGVNLLLGAFALGHAQEARIGIHTLLENVQHLEVTDDHQDVMFLGIDTLYAATMAAVSLRQISLMRKANVIRHRRLRRPLQDRNVLPVTDRGATVNTEAAPDTIQRPSTAKPRKMLARFGLALAVTGSGQAAMLYSNVHAANESNQVACVASAKVAAHEAGPALVSDDYYQQQFVGEWSRACHIGEATLTAQIVPHPNTYSVPEPVQLGAPAILQNS